MRDRVDREIAASERRRRVGVRVMVTVVPVVAVLLLLAWLPDLLRPGVSRARIRTARVTTGPVDAMIMASGTIVPEIERAFATPNRIAPDRLAQSGRRAQFLAVNDRATLSDGARTIDIHRITDSVHNDTFLMVHLPAEKILIEADAYTPLAPNAQPPALPNANNVNLIANIERLKLQVERIAPLHGRVVPLADLYTTARATAPR